MHFFIDNRPVYREGEIDKSFDNSLYFYSKFTNNCPICLSYHEQPCIIPCGHSFCTACLTRLIEFSNTCPVCCSFFWASKPVKFFFLEEISTGITFRRLTTQDVSSIVGIEFFEYPYCCYYYDRIDISSNQLLDPPSNTLSSLPHENIDFTSLPNNISFPFLLKKTNPQCNFVFYQSADGQLYFLNPKTYRNYKYFPKYIFGQIKNVYAYKGGECKYPELQHIPHHYHIYIVTIY